MELNNVCWVTIGGITCIGFCDEGIVMPNKDLTEAVVISHQYCYMGPITVNEE